MEDSEDKGSGRCVPNYSLIEEIRARDIYTLHSSDKCPTLPSVTSFSTSGGESQINRENIGRRSSPNCRWVMKKLAVQQMKLSSSNLPALIEEDNLTSTSHPLYFDPKRTDCDAEKTSQNVGAYLVGCNEETLQDGSEDEGEEDDDDSSLEVLDNDESWVDLSKHTQPPSLHPASGSFSQAFASPSPCAMPLPPTSPDRVTPLPFGNGEEYLRLLREAQKESNQSSARVSLASSRRDTPRDSPKSPPNSPNTEIVLDTEETQLKGVYINYYNREGDFVRVEKNIETDWIWDWSSRPDQTPPKEWRFVHPRKGTRRGASIRRLMVGNSSLFSRDVMYTLLITNVLSFLLGTGIGIWLSKRSGGGSVSLSTIPIN